MMGTVTQVGQDIVILEMTNSRDLIVAGIVCCSRSNADDAEVEL
jgi:hypothetical protein